MARKSRYTSPLRDTSDVRPQCIAAIYLRLSVEDGDSLESNSIGNQRKICLAFLEKHSDFEIFRAIYTASFFAAFSKS